jgi:hypothetical protein
MRELRRREQCDRHQPCAPLRQREPRRQIARHAEQHADAAVLVAQRRRERTTGDLDRDRAQLVDHLADAAVPRGRVADVVDGGHQPAADRDRHRHVGLDPELEAEADAELVVPRVRQRIGGDRHAALAVDHAPRGTGRPPRAAEQRGPEDRGEHVAIDDAELAEGLASRRTGRGDPRVVIPELGHRAEP